MQLISHIAAQAGAVPAIQPFFDMRLPYNNKAGPIKIASWFKRIDIRDLKPKGEITFRRQDVLDSMCRDCLSADFFQSITNHWCRYLLQNK